MCIHIYIYIYIHACMHAYMHTYMHTCIHAYMHTCIHTYMHTCIHTFVWMLMIQRAFWFLNQLPGVCSGGEGTPPETLKCLTPNPYS